MSQFGEFAGRVDGAERVGDVGERGDADLTVFLFKDGSGRDEIQLAVGSDRDEAEARADPLSRNLPGHQVGVVLHLGEEDDVPFGEGEVCEGVSDQIDAFGGASGEDDAIRVGVEE